MRANVLTVMLQSTELGFGTLVEKTIGWALLLLLALLLLINGTVMMVSPRKWFELPNWIAARGTLRAGEYSRGLGGLQVRILGAMLVGIPCWVCFDIFTR